MRFKDSMVQLGRLFEQPAKSESYVLSSCLFLRLLGLIYLLAFLSLFGQIDGLIGQDGILPVRQVLSGWQSSLGAERYWLFPTLVWLNPSNQFLELLSGGGVLLSILVIAGMTSWVTFFLLWLFYLSLVTVGAPFMSFQWDSLLLETGFLSIFLSIGQPLSLPGLHFIKQRYPPPAVFVWLLRFLLFKLLFLSGSVKLLSGDPNWRNLTALNYHYQTQPLPTPLAWYAAQLPEWFEKLSVMGVFGLELLLPFLIFAPRPMRMLSAGLICFLQILIALTGNYTFFNFLTMTLCVMLLDDTCLAFCFPKAMRDEIRDSEVKPALTRRLPRYALALVAAVIMFASSARLLETVFGQLPIPSPVAQALDLLSVYQIANSYGLFAVMTVSRLEIIVEGSNDLKTWLPYEFKYKPGDLKTAPPWVAPHQPRLDWQMWFAALGTPQDNPWFVRFLVKLLDGSRDVIALLKNNPFPARPPVYIRAQLYQYHFTDEATRKATGNWWQRDDAGIYMPTFSLEH